MASAFEVDAFRVLQDLRTSLAAVIAALPAPASKPAELVRALGIDINLSCRVFRIVDAASPLAAGLHVPASSALRTFLNAARKAGVSEQIARAGTVAAEEFDQLVGRHAGDRTAFESMISSFATADTSGRIALQHRRAAFRAQRYLFGVQAKLKLQCFIVQPAADPRMVDYAQVGGLVSLRRMRSNAPLVISHVYASNDEGAVLNVTREPLEPALQSTHGMALLPEFCSHPLPEFRTRQTAGGIVCGELVSDGVGKSADVTCIEGHVTRAAFPRYRGVGQRLGWCAHIRVPCEVVILDQMVRDDTFGRLDPAAYACAEHLGDVTAPEMCEDWQCFKPRETVSYLGKGPSVLYSADFPRYTELGQSVFEKLGWEAERFDVYRCRIEYPVMPSVVAMAFDMPPDPSV